MADDTPQELDTVYQRWLAEIECYEKKFKSWEERGKKIIKTYKDFDPNNSRRKVNFNILWSNVQILSRAIYAQTPNPNIDRRFQDNDDLGLKAAVALERSAAFFVKTDLFDRVMNQAVLDRLLPGRGTAWVRYYPQFEEPAGLTDDVEGEQEAAYLKSEDVCVDYVHWQDFGHTFARTWEETKAVWRVVKMTRKDLVKRFGEELGRAIPLDAVEGDDKEQQPTAACIYEIWDKASKKVYWLSKKLPRLLEEMDDPLGLKDFFPCPAPLFATLTNDDLVPTPDYSLYQDQAIELNILTRRINSLLRAVRVAGVYDAQAAGIDRLLSEGAENKLIPVEQFAVLGQGKGLDGVVSFFPVEQVVQTIVTLQQAREALKADIYEITGISDIVRGATKATETATAQQIKGQYASLRLDGMQRGVANFGRDLVHIITEIIAKHFSIETIAKISGLKLLTEQEKQQIQMMMQMHQQQAQMAEAQGMQPPPAPPIPEEALELLELPTWQQIEALIRDDTARSFRIDIETDSTIKADQDAERQARTEFLAAVGGFLQQSVAAPPELQPLLMEMLMFGVRAFKVGRDIETTFETTLQQIRKNVEAQEQQPPAPSPEEQRAQADMQVLQAQAQVDAQKAQVDLQMKQMDLEMKRMELQSRMVEAQMKLSEREAAGGEVQNIAEIVQQAIAAAMPPAPVAPELPSTPAAPIIVNVDAAQPQGAKTVAIVRDASGKITGATVQEEGGF